MVEGTIELEAPADAGALDASPLSGTISITHDGWDVKGSFHTDTVCALSVSH